MIRYLTELDLEAFIEAARNVPYQHIGSDLFPGIDLWVRRDDLIDPVISGNKAYKLIYNLIEARKQGKDTIVTCGGAWSNHVHATAAAGQRFGFKTIGVIRGERPPVLSAMLRDAERFGMELKFVSRAHYRWRHELDFCSSIGLNASEGWFIPEGGANQQGAKGIRLLGKAIGETRPVDIDECWLACGTGLTLGALASSLPPSIHPVGVAVLKAEKSVATEVASWCASSQSRVGFKLVTDAHEGGYGKSSESLLASLRLLGRQADLPLDHVYTAKVAHALMRHCAQNDKNTSKISMKRVVLLHTGGLQGRRGLSEKPPKTASSG